MCQPLIKFHPHPAIITQVLRIFEINSNILALAVKNIQVNLIFLARLFVYLHSENLPFNT